MMRLIDADMVRQGKFCLNPLHADKDDTYYYQLGWNSAIETICDCVPTVEPKHGHWVFNGKPIEKWSHGNYCSVCGEYNEECGNYCSYCGAEMDAIGENDV